MQASPLVRGRLFGSCVCLRVRHTKVGHDEPLLPKSQVCVACNVCWLYNLFCGGTDDIQVKYTSSVVCSTDRHRATVDVSFPLPNTPIMTTPTPNDLFCFVGECAVV